MRSAGAAAMRKAPQHRGSRDGTLWLARHTDREPVTLRTHDAPSFWPEGILDMEAKFAVGDRVDQSPRDRFVGTVKAVYTTREGETRYAVDMEGHGTLRLCSEHTIVAHNH
jgi:hypothetical protein